MTNYVPTAFFREITARIRGHLARFDLNIQVELAILCDVSQSQFSKIIRGVRPMTLDQLVVVCDAIGMDVATLVTEVEKFVTDRDLNPSPIKYVIDEDREENPKLYNPQYLDDWGKAAYDRMVVGGYGEDPSKADLREDHDLAASEDDSTVDPERQA